MRAEEFIIEADEPTRIKLGGGEAASRAQAWIEKVYSKYPHTMQNNHVMTWGSGDDLQFAMFELVPSFSKRGAVEVKWFQAYPLRAGVGSRAMQELQALAREDGISLTLFPWDKGQVSQSKLTKFYRGQGFAPTVKGGKAMAWTPEQQGVAEGAEQQYLWHGSRQEISMLEPRQSVDTGGATGSNQNAIYATSDPKVAIAMGLTTSGSDTGMFPNDPQMVLFSGKIRKGENVYLHKLPFNGPDGEPQFVQGGNSREFHSVPGVKGIKPIEIKAVPVDKYLNLIRQATPQDLELRKKYMKQGVTEGKIKLSTDPNWYGAEVGDYKASGPVVNIPANSLVGFEPDDKMNQPASKANVEKIVAGLKQGAKLPPLLVRKYKNGYQVLDGHHRFWAYKLLRVKSIPAQVVPDEDVEEISKQGIPESLSVDVPNEEWLQSAIDYAKEKSPDRHGLPYMGKTTATVRQVEVPVNLLRRIPGMRREQQNVRYDDLAAIEKIMKDTGKLPLHGHTGEEYKPFINVAYDGSAWVNEGNHRIMAAYRLGWDSLPVQISYFDGGERVENGPMYPGKIGL